MGYEEIPLAVMSIRRLHEGIETYQPILEGLTLLPEEGKYGHSLANLRQLNLQKRVIGFVAGRSGVMVLFSDGDQYLATGFAVGREVPHEKVRAFAEFASEGMEGSFRRWKNMLFALPSDVKGEISLDPEDPDAGYEPENEDFHQLRPYFPLDLEISGK